MKERSRKEVHRLEGNTMAQNRRVENIQVDLPGLDLQDIRLYPVDLPCLGSQVVLTVPARQDNRPSLVVQPFLDSPVCLVLRLDLALQDNRPFLALQSFLADQPVQWHQEFLELQVHLVLRPFLPFLASPVLLEHNQSSLHDK